MEIVSLIVGLLVGILIGYVKGYLKCKKIYEEEDFHHNFFPVTKDEAEAIVSLNPKKIIFLYDNNQSEPFIHCIDNNGEEVDITDYKKYA